VTSVEVYLEQGRSRTFAVAVDWPGWARWARTSAGEEAALEALLGHADRYAQVARDAGARFPASPEPVVVERVAGGATTDFGAPGAVLGTDRDPLPETRLARHLALLESSWALLDVVAARAPAELRKGPRGGGRDRDEVVRHVVEAERAYAAKAGARHRPFDPHDHAARDAMRADLVAALRGQDPAAPWPSAYAVRRIAWHVLDHVWEIEDRST
jgi:hypothetical protein